MAGILHAMNVPMGGSSGLMFAIDTPNVVISDLLLSQGWDGISVVNPLVVIQATAKIYSNSTALPALDTGTLPAGSTVTIYNYGYILGRGGNGGAGGNVGSSDTPGSPGGNGGLAIRIRVPTTINNLGVIGGGGGGGGGGGTSKAYGGGGGIGGSGGGAGGYNSYLGIYSYSGEGGTLIQQGRGGNGGFYGNNGGFYGQNGFTGPTGGTPGGAGGAAGAAVYQNSLVTWVTSGTIYGALVP